MPDKALPRSAKALVNKLDDQWLHRIVWGHGERTVRVDGLVNARPGKVDAVVPVESVSVRAQHRIDHRFLVALWVSVNGDTWKFDDAFRKAVEGDWPVGLPVILNSAETTAFATARDIPSAMAAIADVQAKAAEAAAKRAATRARNKAEQEEQEVQAA
jgi:hypothetical protein